MGSQLLAAGLHAYTQLFVYDPGRRLYVLYVLFKVTQIKIPERLRPAGIVASVCVYVCDVCGTTVL